MCPAVERSTVQTCQAQQLPANYPGSVTLVQQVAKITPYCSAALGTCACSLAPAVHAVLRSSRNPVFTVLCQTATSCYIMAFAAVQQSTSAPCLVMMRCS
jgi:hypothetical protein